LRNGFKRSININSWSITIQAAAEHLSPYTAAGAAAAAAAAVEMHEPFNLLFV